MKALLSICFLLGLAFSVNSLRVKTHAKSQSTQDWQSYIDSSLIAGGMTGAMIVDKTNGNVLASRNLNLKPGEGFTLIINFKDTTSFKANGLFVNGQKYYVVNAQPKSVYATSGNGGIILVGTNKAIVVGTYDSRLSLAAASGTVEWLADYLRSSGY